MSRGGSRDKGLGSGFAAGILLAFDLHLAMSITILFSACLHSPSFTVLIVQVNAHPSSLSTH